MTTDGFLTRAEVNHLSEKLGHVRDLESEMAIALTGETRAPSTGYTRHQRPGSRPPYPIHIEDLLDRLTNELDAAADSICKHRGLDYDGGHTLSGRAAWINRYRFALSMIEDADQTFDRLCKIIDTCRRTMNHTDQEWSGYQVEEANRQILNAYQIEKLAKRIGEQGWGLNRQRIARLTKRGRLHPIRTTTGDRDANLYRLGDVLDAHAKTPRRGA